MAAALLDRMAFSGCWRDYQRRVLEEFDQHAGDRRLHLVAAPGSGKTVVGLEMLRRLGRPALVLAPTQIVRDQWLARLVPLFLDGPPGSAEVSRSLADPAELTAATYQALHALAARGEADWAASLAKSLCAGGQPTLVLDEAHHLRREWWSALTELISHLPNATIIALTATPPYDAPFAEWARYEAMCGPIDLEVTVPELVRNGDLCPHQDHVLFSRADHDAIDLLDRRRRGLAAFLSTIRDDAELLDELAAHPWLTTPEVLVEEILEAPEVLSSILVLLASAGRTLPGAALSLLGARASDLPLPDAFWLETFLNALLIRFPDRFAIGPERTRNWRAALHEHGLIEAGEVRLGESRATFKAMANSVAKLDSIVEIARSEAEALGNGLRMVVLTDHVRAGELPRASDETYVPTQLGVVPIFEMLRRAMLADQRLAVLTGSLVILPSDRRTAAHDSAVQLGLDPACLQFEPLSGCPGYHRLTAQGEVARHLVAVLTRLFCDGQVTMMVGTQALLGEGWDAPALNTLVLASNSAAFMLSNQMRGRAIRVDPDQPGKVANIWHLATIDRVPADAFGAIADRLDWGRIAVGETITSDIDLLNRRFRAFDGIANFGPSRIENGLGRLGLHDAASLEALNQVTLLRARDRAQTARRWAEALGGATPRARLRDTASPSYAPRGLAWYDTLQWLAASAVSSGAFAAANELQGAANLQSWAGFAMAATGAATLAMAPKLLKAGWLFLRNGTLEGSLTQVTQAVMAAMDEAGLLPGDHVPSVSIRISRAISGRLDLSLDGLSRANERMVMQALAEVLGPVQNPRYLLVRRNRLWLRTRYDYHAVPTVLAARKEFAEGFHRSWRGHVGSSQLVFTRNAEGRIALLRARARAFAAGFQRRMDRRNEWA
jgi:hypothetical protein